jgi:hypothetical protein
LIWLFSQLIDTALLQGRITCRQFAALPNSQADFPAEIYGPVEISEIMGHLFEVAERTVFKGDYR